MAGEIGRNVQRFPWATPAGQSIGPAGLTSEEVKINQGVAVSTPDVAPIAQRGPVEFISPSGSSENLRLAVPAAANPFATPTGPKHDHMLIRNALGRSKSDTTKTLMGLLRDPASNLDKKDVGRMRAWVAREHEMLGVLKDLQEMQRDVYGRLIGNQSA